MTTKPLNSTTTSAHVYADTAMEVQPLDMPGSDTVTVRFGDYGCNVTVFMQPADLRRLRDAIDAHLGETRDEARDNAGSDLYVAVEAVVSETCARKPSSTRTTDDPEEAFGEGEAAEGWRLAEMLRAALSAYDGAMQTKTEAEPQPEAPAQALAEIEF